MARRLQNWTEAKNYRAVKQVLYSNLQGHYDVAISAAISQPRGRHLITQKHGAAYSWLKR